MADIMIKCPVFAKPVPTGITTEMIVLDSLTFELTAHCPACRKSHRWKRRDAWVDGDREQGGESRSVNSRAPMQRR
jgi:hypothetical protein